MDKLNNKKLDRIFENLNLNEKATDRQANKQVREACDLSAARNLVIFHQSVPIAGDASVFAKLTSKPNLNLRFCFTGKFEYTDEEYGLADCVRVNDLAAFILDFRFSKMKVRFLKIIGKRTGDLNLIKLIWQFEELVYLSINNCCVQDATILRSPKLDRVVLNGVTFETINLEKGQQFTKCESNQVGQIRELVISKKVDLVFMSYLISNKFTINVEVLRIKLEELKVLDYLLRSKVMPKLKLVYCDLIGKCLDDFLNNETYLRQFANDIEKLNVDVYLFGLKFNKETLGEMISSIKSLDKSIEITRNNLKLRITDRFFRFIRTQKKNKKLTGLFDLVQTLEILDPHIFDEDLFKKINCITLLFFLLSSPVDKEIEKYLRWFKGLKMLMLSFLHYDIRIDNRILDLIPKYQPALEILYAVTWNPIDFRFLFPLNRLSQLELHLYYPIENATYLELLTRLKSLQYMNIICTRPNSSTNAELLQFRQHVLNYVKTNLKIKKVTFKIQIYKKGNNNFLRYIYYKGSLLDHKILDISYRNNYFKMIEFKLKTKQFID